MPAGLQLLLYKILFDARASVPLLFLHKNVVLDGKWMSFHSLLVFLYMTFTLCLTSSKFSFVLDISV